jgi:hypothetical protein
MRDTIPGIPLSLSLSVCLCAFCAYIIRLLPQSIYTYIYICILSLAYVSSENSQDDGVIRDNNNNIDSQAEDSNIGSTGTHRKHERI